MGRARPTRERPVTIRAYPDGPLLVRGDVRLVDADGDEVPCHRHTIALCRCGRSRLAPFCDGTHKLLANGDRPATGSGHSDGPPRRAER
jgi:CDGSH-type Zn-finger protein